ncbi:hypothetical protein PF003_g15373 [Phytophthora fragariae]|nr:hypothetical protein PF003_g15373 [Phytophthora fragariae]
MQQKEEPPGGEVPGPPPPEVINLCQLSQGDEDSYMPEQIAGVKRIPEAEAESPDSDGDDSPDLDSIKMTRNLDARVKDNEDEEKTETNQPSPAIKEESVTEDETANSQDDNPPQFDDSDAVVLTFAEMHNYLHEEMKDLDNQAAKEVESANEYMQSMFAQVFTSHPAETLDDSKSQYPQLNEAEIEALLRLFIQDRKVGRADARKMEGKTLRHHPSYLQIPQIANRSRRAPYHDCASDYAADDQHVGHSRRRTRSLKCRPRCRYE